MRGFAILLGFSFIGTALELLANIPLPGSVIGMILLFLALCFGWIKLEWVEASASWLLKHMMLLFAPFVIGVMNFYPLLQQEWAAILTSQLLGTMAVILTTALVAKLWPGGQKRERY